MGAQWALTISVIPTLRMWKRRYKPHHHHVTNQAIASMPSTPRPTGAEGRGSTAPECLQVTNLTALVLQCNMAAM
jgi:hypothetical protein